MMEWVAGAVVVAWGITSVTFHHNVAIVCWSQVQFQVACINLKYYLFTIKVMFISVECGSKPGRFKNSIRNKAGARIEPRGR